MTDIYTAVSFAPVQGFIEKSRKLRDLYGASLILSYLSQKIVEEFHHPPELEVISPALIHVQEGMPNRILIKGYVERSRVENTLLKHWQHLLTVCRKWVEDNAGIPKEQYHWTQTPDQVGQEKGEWERWGSYAWEVFCGKGDSPNAAMEDLETRKLKRDWTAINWMGESSSLSGTDAIAWHRLGRKYEKGEYQPGQSLTDAEKQELELFYRRLSWVLDDPEQRKAKDSGMSPASDMSLEKLRAYEKANPEGIGRYIAVNERLSIPELVKRLITYDKIDAKEPEDQKLKIAKLKEREDDPEFKDIYREAGYWTGWFMGDGDKVGDKLKELADRYPNAPKDRDAALHRFTELMRNWGRQFKGKKFLFPDGKGRVIYAGGDDFLGVLYSEDERSQEDKPEKVKPIEAWNWLVALPDEWQQLQADLKNELDLDFTYSVGFVWAGHQVPQRDILQHCREAEKQAKSLGRDRVTIRVVFNSGQYVQWTCPWDYLDILTKYRDRNQKAGSEANWNHLYSDWAALQSRHAIQLKAKEEQLVNKEIAIQIFDFYFDNAATQFTSKQWGDFIGHISGSKERDLAIMNWMNDLIQVGWQLCRSSNL